MRVALFGGTGYVGRYVTEELIKRGHTPVLLVRSGSGGKIKDIDNVEIVNGDISDRETVMRTLEISEAAIYLVGIIREFPEKGITYRALHFEGARNAIDAAKEKGIRKFVLMSANGAGPSGTGYQRTKFDAEKYLRCSGLKWTIFRPSVIFGDPHGGSEFCTDIKNRIVRSPFPGPLFYPGILPRRGFEILMSPIYAGNVAEFFVKSLEMEKSDSTVFTLCGPETVSWKKIIEMVASATGKKKLFLPAPAAIVKALAFFFERYGFFPVTRDQLTMLLEGNSCDSSDSFRFFEIEPVLFAEENLTYLGRV